MPNNKCPHCGDTCCPGRHGSPHYSNEDFDVCQEYQRAINAPIPADWKCPTCDQHDCPGCIPPRQNLSCFV